MEVVVVASVEAAAAFGFWGWWKTPLSSRRVLSEAAALVCVVRNEIVDGQIARD